MVVLFTNKKMAIMDKKERQKALDKIKALGEEEYQPYYDGNSYRSDMLSYRKLVLYFCIMGYLSIALCLYSGYQLLGKNDFTYYLGNYSGDMYETKACKRDQAPYCNSNNIRTRLVE